ncbi:class I SAM-dependent methyltransferase family protein [Candidatus Micrarchaeota archaeon]|nr:class I SAM-dependent methyltransferase family protein [Candidatus Micrarchaeota archaeon]
MLGLRVEKKNAEKARKLLLEQGCLSEEFSTFSDSSFVYFPVCSKEIELPFKAEFISTKFPKKTRQRGFHEILAESKKFTKRELALVPRAFDLIGDIALIEIPPALRKKGREIADALLKSSKRIKTVLAKAPVRGRFRVRRAEFLGGEEKTETVYKEAGCVFKMDLAKVYFSPRLSFERARIVSLVKDGERILVPFAGVGSFPLTIALRKQVKIVAIELNPHAVRFMHENLRLNRVGEKVLVIEGDAKELMPKFDGWANRIIMLLPEKGPEFLDAAVKAAAPDGVIHFYAFSEKTQCNRLLKKIAAACKKNKRSFKVLNQRIVAEYSPKIVEFVIDFGVL